MVNQLKRLRLKEGDIIVVRDQDTADALMKVRVKGIPPCPIIVTPDSIHRLSADYIRRLLAKKDASNTPTSTIGD